MDKKDISIIIVNWNTKNLLLDCVNSIFEKTKKCNIEIIVVDNASSDGSKELFETSFPNILFIQNKENLGFSKANNIGIKQSSGKYICLINTDVLLKNNALDLMFNYMENNKKIAVLNPKSYDTKGNIRRCIRELPTKRNLLCEALFLDKIFKKSKTLRGRAYPLKTYEKSHLAGSVSGAFMMVRKTAMNKVGLLDEMFFFYGEDVDWCIRYKDAGWNIAYYADAEIIHFGGSSSKSAPVKYVLQKLKSDVYFWQKHFKSPSLKQIKFIQSVNYFIRMCIWLFLFLISIKNKQDKLLKFKGYFACFKWINLKRT